MPASDSDKRILIVDDDRDLAEVLGEVLETAGYRTSVAHNGREALARLRDGAPSSMVLLDLMMPDMNGWEFRAEQLRDQSLAAIPVVAFSGDGNVEQKGAALGAVQCLRKPVRLDQLLRVIERICGPAAGHGQPRLRS
jgi:two-component system response regulator MprA